MLTAGTILGDRYEIIEKIGAGGMSIVYKAKCNRLQRFVAIKVLREEFVTDEDFVAKFRKEALAAASLSHPNIVGIYDVGSDQDLHFIVMEYIEGKTLKDLISEKGPFDSRMVLEFGMEIVSALRHAHRKKIIHRDIKPQNILVTHDQVLKVTDFGIAKAVDSSTVVATGNAIGSVHYFSPEQAKGKYVNETSDLYSCGIVLFELATRKLPFEADSHISIALKHINEDLPLPSKFNPHIISSLEKLILKATDKSQAARYQDADEMLKDMKGIIANPNYIVQTQEVSDHTILLSDSDAAYIRNNGNKSARNNSDKTAGNYTEKPELNENDEDDEEVSTLYKVLVSVGGVLATLVILSMIATAIFLWLPSMGKSKEIEVPDLTGQTIEQAEKFLSTSKLKLKLNLLGEEASDLAPPGTIFKQAPGQKELVKADTIIDVTLATEIVLQDEPIRVPDLIALDWQTAQQSLYDLDLNSEIEQAYDDMIEIGKVIDQRPIVGTEVKSQDIIKLIISKGPQIVMVRVPNLANMTVQNAEISLRNEKLKLGAQKEGFSDTVSEGLIMSQTINAGKEVEEGSGVDVVVSKGKEEIVPDPEEPVPDEPISPEQTELVTKTFTLLSVPEHIEAKEVYHVLIRLETDDGSKTAFDEQVRNDKFPLDIPIKGRGKGRLFIYFDGVPSYEDSIHFNEVQ